MPLVEKKEKEELKLEIGQRNIMKKKKNSFTEAFEASLIALIGTRRGSDMTQVRAGLRLDGFDQEKRKCLKGSKVVPFPLQPT